MDLARAGIVEKSFSANEFICMRGDHFEYWMGVVTGLVRIGTGSPDPQIDMKDWVLGRIPQKQRAKWNAIEDMAWTALESWLSDGIQIAMSRVNGLKADEEDKTA